MRQFSVLFLEQIAPFVAANESTCYEDFCGCRVRKMASEVPEIISEFGTQLKECMSVGIMIEYFCRKRLHFEWNNTMSSFRLITYSLVPLLLLKQQQQGLFEL